jgi:acyl-CoA synthetase (AMP-forming)/AMP-acid ligase II
MKGDIINVGEGKVYLQEVENIIQEINDVAKLQFIVKGIPLWGILFVPMLGF